MKFQPLYFGSLDARTIQYKYAIYKLQRLVQAISELLNRVETSSGEIEHVVLVHYIVHLSSTLFAINEQKFGPRLAALENFKPVKTTAIAISPTVTHVPYDFKDVEVTPLSEMPSPDSTIQALKSLRYTAENCLEGYRKRLTNAEGEIGNENFCDDLDKLIASMMNPAVDIDISLQLAEMPIPAFNFPLDKEYSESSDGMEASLIDMDLHVLFVLTKSISSIIKSHKVPQNKFKELKAASKQNQEALLRAMPQSGYALHRVLVWALRLNDLYSIVRRFGRQIYLSNYQHLHDPKFLSHMPNVNAFKTQILKSVDELFTTAKKNGVLVATITRFIRLSTRVEITVKLIIEFFGFIGQSFTLVENLAKALDSLGKSWLACELNFRVAYGLPKKNLSLINDYLEREKLELLRKQNEKNLKDLALQKERANSAAVSPPPKQKATERMKNLMAQAERQESAKPESSKSQPPRPASPLKNLRTKTSSPVLRPAHSATRASSLNSANIPNVRAFNGTVGKRPSSQLFETASINSVDCATQGSGDTVDKNAAVNTTASGRRRSNSSPISFNAAAAALATNHNQADVSKESKTSLRSPTGSIRRAANFSRQSNAPNVTSPLASKTVKLTTLEESSEPESAVQKLTAQQKFALHLKEASKNGLIHSQQRESLSSVVFDPNNPSATKIYRPAETTKSPPLANDSAPRDDGAPTRAQVTKQNTQRNSMVIKDSAMLEVKPRESAESTTSTPNTVLSNTPTRDSASSAEGGVVIKKVRFTGVPEYSPEEDAPTRYSRKLMKNFAIFKQPLMSSRHSSLKSKDSMLKKEESFLLKQQQASPR
ncbi:hypothetical protein ACI3LY_000047 [Candidozyma auris]|uniref:Uncharacterized protein n=2 Tax=Candidozyma auris TaxID=498019 RepID=A0A2H1A5W6_CANAR|nr:hypothetical_protein [[Candida] auris]KNE00084.2 hypothetical protein QG37_03031 [[Candida] auris]PIS57972.1 hypothetical protein CJI97_001028 [[Candida] auris]PIS58508.1 hypothetical protein B9J08_001008 [[Candida] auris]QEO20580.1 hypothetical_protein [[Candida] auris]QWW23740.1 hypothetical protein CA7LBN_002541 [[Candida] auris]